MRVVVTGSSGKLGRAAMTALRAAGHRPVGFDIKPSADGERTVLVDCTDLGQLMSGLSGVDLASKKPDAVVHLAGIPSPSLATDDAVFTNNTQSAYNVFTSCARLGINRVAWASSESIFGLPYTTDPDFFPVDDTHPVRPEWHYSMSKALSESMADTFTRWSPQLSIASLRFSNVIGPEDATMLAGIQADPRQRRMNAWGYVDARDAARACVLAIEAEFSGHERAIIAAADTMVAQPTSELHDTYFPNVALSAPLVGHSSLISSRHAAEVFNYQPQFSWRDW